MKRLINKIVRSFDPYPMLMKKLFIVIAAIALFQGIAKAQQFPVQVTPQLLPPYSVKVSDYYSPGAAGTKLNLLLLLRDFNKPQLQVRLRMSIEGQSVSIRTREDAVFTPLTIESGTPFYVDPSDLAQYFDPNKLDFSGITAQQYTQTGKLPEGFYTFCFEAIEVTTNQSVSNKGCAFGWLTLNEPPILNIPRKAETLVFDELNPQNLIFQWTPRHTASPTAAFNTEYKVTIVRMAEDDIAPEAAMLTGVEVHTETVTTTTISVNPGAVGMPGEGERYAWRVQAIAKEGGQDLASFRNQGYSETFWFTYGTNCTAPTGVSASAQGQRVNIEWTTNPEHLEYKVEYREANDPDAVWFETGNTLPRVSITDLKPGTLYEYRVGGACEYGRFTFGNLLPFTSNHEDSTTVPYCGTDPNLTDPPNTPGQLSQGDIIYAGDYEIKVTSVTAQSPYSGEGYVKMSWLAGVNVAVRFTGVTVNVERKLTNGVIETTYDPNESGIVDVAIIEDFFKNAGIIIKDLVNSTISKDYREIKQLTEEIRTLVNKEFPQDLKEDINEALDEIDMYKKEYDSLKAIYDALPNGPEKDAVLEQMETAQTNFNNAKQQVETLNQQKDELIDSTTDIIITAIQNLRDRAANEKTTVENDYNAKKQVVINYLENQDNTIETLDGLETDVLIIKTDIQKFDSLELTTNSNLQGIGTQALNYYKAREKLYLNQLHISMGSKFNKTEAARRLGNVIKSTNGSLIREIIEKIRNNETETTIVQFAEGRIISYLVNFIIADQND